MLSKFPVAVREQCRDFAQTAFVQLAIEIGNRALNHHGGAVCRRTKGLEMKVQNDVPFMSDYLCEALGPLVWWIGFG